MAAVNKGSPSVRLERSRLGWHSYFVALAVALPCFRHAVEVGALDRLRAERARPSQLEERLRAPRAGDVVAAREEGDLCWGVHADDTALVVGRAVEIVGQSERLRAAPVTAHATALSAPCKSRAAAGRHRPAA